MGALTLPQTELAPPLTSPDEIVRLRHPEAVPRWDQLEAWGD